MAQYELLVWNAGSARKISTRSVACEPPRAPVEPFRPPFCGGKQPLFLAALAFGCGIVAARFLWHPPIDWTVAALLLIACCRASQQRRPTLRLHRFPALALAMAGALGVTEPQAASRLPDPRIAPRRRVRSSPRTWFVTACCSAGCSEVSSNRSTWRPSRCARRMASEFTQRRSACASRSTRGNPTTKMKSNSRLVRLPMPVAQIWAAAATHGQTARAAQLRQSRGMGLPRLSAVAGHRPCLAVRGSVPCEFLPGFAGHRWTAWQHRARAAVIAKHPRTLARRRSISLWRHSDRRSLRTRQRRENQFPEHGHISHPRRLRHERRHSGVRVLLALPPPALGRCAGDHCAPLSSPSAMRGSPTSAHRSCALCGR